MSSEIISFINVSYDELRIMTINQLEQKITKNIMTYYEKIPQLKIDQKMKM